MLSVLHKVQGAHLAFPPIVIVVVTVIEMEKINQCFCLFC